MQFEDIGALTDHESSTVDESVPQRDYSLNLPSLPISVSIDTTKAYDGLAMKTEVDRSYLE